MNVEAAASATDTSHRPLTIALFVAFIAVTLIITYLAGRRTKTVTDFYAAGRSFSGFQNGLAISGDYMSAASLLGIAGLIALFGYDGFLYSVGWLVAYIIVLLLIAELLRNSGRFTMADVLSYRLHQRPVRTAAATSTLFVSIFYLLAQMVAAGTLVKLLLGVSGDGAAILTIVCIGILMVVYVVVGGMRGTTWVQIIKAGLLMGGAVMLSIWVLAKFGWGLNNLLNSAKQASGKGQAFLQPGLRYSNGLDLVSLGFALILGTAGLPHILIRFYTVPTSRAARSSVNWAITLIGSFYIMTIFLGFGAAALVGAAEIKKANKGGNMAAPLLAQELGGGKGTAGGALLLAVISSIAFATIIAVVAGLTLAASSSFAHDLWVNVVRRGRSDDRIEVRTAKIAAVGIGAVAIALAVALRNLNVAFLVGLVFAVAASANLPTILFSLYWKRFTTAGAVASIYGGLAASIILVAMSPVVIGKDGLLAKGTEPPFTLENPGIISIPFGFLVAIVVSLLTREPSAERSFKGLEVRALSGAGAEV